MPLPSLFSCMFVMGCWHFKSTIQYVSVWMANQNLQSPEGKTQTRDRSHEHVWKKLSSSSWWLTRSNQLLFDHFFCQHISTHTGLKSNNVSSPPPNRKRRTLSDLATTAFAVKLKKIKKCSTQHYACLATNSSKLQSMAVGSGQRTSSHALVLLNGLFHTVLLICWNHANACFHGIDWATKAWEERLESRWRLLCNLVLHLLFGSLLHALLHATQQRCHCFKNKAGSVDCENADATKRLQPKQHDNMICHLSSAWISFCHPLSRNSKNALHHPQR